MARKTVLVSDLSGAEVAEGSEVKIVLSVNGKRFEADAAMQDEVVQMLLGVSRQVGKRGRPKKS